jgi:hypothetical protein
MLSVFLGQFRDFLIIVLIIAAAVSFAIGETMDAMVIFVIVILNAIIGFVQEYRAEKSLEALKKMVSPSARVIRGGHEVKIPAIELVPGDIILLEAGDKVPADVKTKVEGKITGLKDASAADDVEAMKKAMEELQTELMAVGQAVYSQGGAPGAPEAAPGGEGPAGEAPGAGRVKGGAGPTGAVGWGRPARRAAAAGRSRMRPRRPPRSFGGHFFRP